MKIIYRGTLPSERTWRGTCRLCGSKAEASESEMKNIRYDYREGDSYSWEQCPVCSAGKEGYGGMLFYPIK
jgi:hypothetical protein